MSVGWLGWGLSYLDLFLNDTLLILLSYIISSNPYAPAQSWRIQPALLNHTDLGEPF